MTDETTSLAPGTEASEEVVATPEIQEADVTPDDGGQADLETSGAEPEVTTTEGETEEVKTRRQRQREAKKAKVAAEQAELDKLRIQREALKAAQSEEPKEDDFDDYEDYRAAKAVHMFASKQSASQEAQISAQEQAITDQQTQQKQQEFRRQIEEAQGRYENFNEVAFKAPISDEVAGMVAESEVGADLAYFLGSNPEQARFISTLPTLTAARELGRIEATLTAPKPKTQTSAPAPIKPVDGGISPAKDPEKMTMAEYRQWREGGGS